MDKNIAVLGVGAIGSCIGADLTRAGYDVSLIDQWPAHVEAMRAGGLRVTRMEEVAVKVRAYHLCDLAGLNAQFDIVFLASKSYDSRWLASLIEPYLKPDGVLVSTQNSLNDEWIAPIIGADRDIGCALELAGEVFEPGLVKRNVDRAHTRFVVGELNGGMTERVREVARILGAVGIAEVTGNIWSAKWTKLVFNSMGGSSVASAAGMGLTPLLRNHPEYLDLCVRIGKESIRVARALGHELHAFAGLTAGDLAGSLDEALKKLLLKVSDDSSVEGISHVLQDLKKGRRTEIPGYINGLVVKKAREAGGVPTPCNEAVVSLYRRLENKELKPALSNLDLLEREMTGT
jgi:2-dehydropantoate 2-reductase